jgi:hypothetical protein
MSARISIEVVVVMSIYIYKDSSSYKYIYIYKNNSNYKYIYL